MTGTSESHPALGRRLVVCLDGTWNHTYMRKRRADGHAVVKPSNVLKLARAIQPTDQHGRPQIVYYDVGVGSLAAYPSLSNRTLALSDKLLGGSLGAGFEAKIEAALNFLTLNHEPGDSVLIFGFSRGAATARALTHFIDWADGLPAKRDAYYLPHLFHAYVASEGTTPSSAVIAALNHEHDRIPHRPRLGPMQPVDVQLLGVWDTVMALGSRLRALGARTSGAHRRFHVISTPAACVRHARQALAIDEARYDFRPEIWTSHHPGQTLQQRWFAGVHSNIGGGYVDDGLANIAFRWIAAEAAAVGLETDPKFIAHYNPYPQDRLYRSDSKMYRVADAVRARAGRGRRQLTGWNDAANLTIDKSVISRIQADPDKRTADGKLRWPDLRRSYRPRNVLDFLRAQPDPASYLRELSPDHPALPEDWARELGTP